MNEYKFGSLVDNVESLYRYPHVWRREQTKGPARLVLAPSGNQVDLILDLCSKMQGPFGLLYVLLVSRRNRTSGRYQTREPMSFAQLSEFLNGFRAYLEGDGRHHLWVMSIGDRSQVIYDNHDVLYAYGNLNVFEDIARTKEMKLQDFLFPFPHAHHYNECFDKDEDRIFEECQWIYFPLRPDDDP